VNEKGERCPAKGSLEYDHVKPVAKGGETTVDNLRLRCRAHNQLAAEQAFGVGFMHEKRDSSKRVSSTKQTAAVKCEAPKSEPTAQHALHEKAFEVIPWLRRHSPPTPGMA